MTRTWFFGCILAVGLITAPAALAQQGEVDTVTVHGQSLEGNLLGASPDRAVAVYLPPGYQEAKATHYPVAYFLHHLDGNQHSWWSASSYGGPDAVSVADDLIAAGTIQPLILVMPDASTRYGACFYANSPVCGGWEDFITQDLVTYVDAHYRTLARASSRAVVGDDAGGYGALVLAMKHPDVFAVAYAMSPLNAALPEPASSAVYSPDAFAMTAPDRAMGLSPTSSLSRAQLAMAAVASPNPNRPPYFVDLPFVEVNGQMQERNDVWQAWVEHTPIRMLDQYRTNLMSLRALGLDVGTNERIPDELPGARALHEALLEAGIPHQFEVFAGSVPGTKGARMATVLPFLADALDGGSGAAASP